MDQVATGTYTAHTLTAYAMLEFQQKIRRNEKLSWTSKKVTINGDLGPWSEITINYKNCGGFWGSFLPKKCTMPYSYTSGQNTESWSPLTFPNLGFSPLFPRLSEFQIACNLFRFNKSFVSLVYFEVPAGRCQVLWIVELADGVHGKCAFSV